MFGDIFGCHYWRACYWHLVVEAQDAVNILGCTGHPNTAKNYLVQNVSGAEVEEPCGELSLVCNCLVICQIYQSPSSYCKIFECRNHLPFIVSQYLTHVIQNSIHSVE